METRLKELQNLGVNIGEELLEGESPVLFENICVKEGESVTDFVSLSSQYLSLMKEYLSSLTDRAFIEHSVYEKLVQHLVVLRENGYRIQRKKGCSYLDLKKGFVFVEPYKTQSISDVDLIEDAFFTLLGNGLPEYYVGFESHDLITKDLNVSLQNCIKICSLRLMNYLIEKGFSYDEVKKTVADCLIAIEREVQVIEEEDFSITMKNFYQSFENQNGLKKEN